MPSLYIMAESEGIMRGWDWTPKGKVTLSEDAIAASLRDLFNARVRRDYLTSDAIRETLSAAGVLVEIERDRVRGKW